MAKAKWHYRLRCATHALFFLGHLQGFQMREAAWDRAGIIDDISGYLERVQVRKCGENP